MSFPLVQPNRECPKPGDFSSYYSIDLLKKQTRAVCGSLTPALPGLSMQDLMPVRQTQSDASQQTGGTGNYAADGELTEKSGCGCQQTGGGATNKSICKVYASNSSLIVPGPALALHAKPIGGRPVVSVQSNKAKPTKSMLDRQFDCLQPKWCENCD